MQLVGKESAYNAGDPDSIPGLERSPGEGNGNPLQYSCLENPMDCSQPGSSVHKVARIGLDFATKPQGHKTPGSKTKDFFTLHFTIVNCERVNNL